MGDEVQVAIIDADIVGKKKHRFPNLACMKLSSYYKGLGNNVTLKTDYEHLEDFNKVFISKVFTATPIPEDVLTLPNVEYGGTGFFYDKAKPLPYEIEHCKPDYHLYDEWVTDCISNGANPKEFEYYTDYSIGFLTRGCFRQCPFCVNRNHKQCVSHSPLSEFIDENRPKLCFLDDNFFACPKWESLLQPVLESGKRFQFKQGLDERLLTKDKILQMSQWKYDGEVIFAFDNIEDKDLITSKLQLVRTTVPEWKRGLKFYVFCGFDKTNTYDTEFWERDIANLFERIHILKQYGALPYIMRYEKVYESEYSSFYAVVTAWCNQPSFFKNSTFRVFSQCRGMRRDGYQKYKQDIEGYLRDIGVKGSSWLAMEMVANQFPAIANKYFDFIGKPTGQYEWLDNLLGGIK